MAPSPPFSAAADQVERPHFLWWASIVFGMSLLSVLALWNGAYAWWATRVTTLFPQPLLRVLLVGALAAHVGEGLYAYRLAARLGLVHSQRGWLLQTLILGFPSLRLLLRRAP